MRQYQWIEANPQVMMGKPVFKGTRIPVDLVLEKLAAGETIEQILESHPRLTPEAIQEALLFADSPRGTPAGHRSGSGAYSSDTAVGVTQSGTAGTLSRKPNESACAAQSGILRLVMCMATIATKQQPTEIIYPDSDGKPRADNTLQADAMTIIYNNLRTIFADDPNVFIAMDLLWYPVEGNPRIRVAPDVLVALGRPKGHRGSYKQWEEGGVAPQVVFEVLSPGNRKAAMNAKRRFYARYGVQEYYVYDPDTGLWQGWVRRGRRLTRVRQMEGWRSPRLGIIFRRGLKEHPGLQRPDGKPFITFEALELFAERSRREAEEYRQRMLEEQRRAERLAQRLRELGVEPEEE